VFEQHLFLWVLVHLLLLLMVNNEHDSIANLKDSNLSLVFGT